MGKKRNNATKKKQAAAKKKRLSSAYGVSVLKGGTTHSSKQNNANATSTTIGIDGKQGKKGGAVPNNGEGNTKHIPDNNSLQQLGKKRARNSNDISEQDDFNHQYASLEERSLALTARKAELQKKKKGNRRQQNKKGWGSKFAGPSSSNTTTIPKFAPATLTLAPKTTQQLVDDAANEVARGMNEIGSSSNHQQSMMVTNPLLGVTTASSMAILPGQSSLAAAASHNWKLRVSNISDTQKQQQQQAVQQSQNNPYAALDTDSDDDSDNEWSDKKKQKVVQQFQFKPASFSFQSSATATSNAVSNDIHQIMGPSVEDNDIDPDL